MLTSIRSLVIGICVILASGCATVDKVAYKPSSATPIKQVLLVTPSEFPKVRIGIDGSPGLMFGAIGAGLAAANAASQVEKLEQAISSQGKGYDQQLVEKITASLAAAGIQTQTVTASRAQSKSGFVDDYKPLLAEKKADAVLDIFVWEASYGATHPILDPDFRPILRVRARLVSATTSETLYADDIFFGYSNPFMSAKEIKAPKQYYYPSLQAVIDDKARAAEGLRVAATEVARFLTDQFISTGNSMNTGLATR